MISRLAISLAFVASFAAASLETVDISANGLTFTCDVFKSTSKGSTRKVMLLHGFPNNRKWFDPLMKEWQTTMQKNLHAVACDLRGYSEGAKPVGIANYEDMNPTFVTDIFELASASFGDKTGFHLVGHDHGSVLGWLVAKKGKENGLVLSFAAMSVPHNDLFSKALCGDDEDPAQILASNYFNQWTEAGAATPQMFANVGAIFGFATLEDMQKAMYWYYAARKHIAIPRVLGDGEVPDERALLKLVRAGLPLDERPCMAQAEQIGKIDIPVMFVCGAEDPFILCTGKQYQSPSSALLPNYEYYEAPQCDHDFFTPANCNDSTSAVLDVMKKITKFIVEVDNDDDGKNCFLSFIPIVGGVLCWVFNFIAGIFS